MIVRNFNRLIAMGYHNHRFLRQTAIVLVVFVLGLLGSFLIYNNPDYYRSIGIALGLKSCLNIKGMIYYDWSASRLRISRLGIANNLALLGASLYLIWNPSRLVNWVSYLLGWL